MYSLSTVKTECGFKFKSRPPTTSHEWGYCNFANQTAVGCLVEWWLDRKQRPNRGWTYLGSLTKKKKTKQPVTKILNNMDPQAAVTCRTGAIFGQKCQKWRKMWLLKWGQCFETLKIKLLPNNTPESKEGLWWGLQTDMRRSWTGCNQISLTLSVPPPVRVREGGKEGGGGSMNASLCRTACLSLCVSTCACLWTYIYICTWERV